MDDEDNELIAGKTYPTMVDLRRAIDSHFASIGCGNIKPTNTATKLKVLCTEHVDCPFELRAFKRKQRDGDMDPPVTITSVNNEHSLVFVEKNVHRKRATSTVPQSVLRPLVEAFMQETENKATGQEIKRHLLNKHKLRVSYHSAWRARTDVLERTRLYGRESYKLIEDWLKRMQQANPGTATRFERTAENQFRRACIVHHAFNTHIQHSLPILALDACHLKTKDKGTMYVASVITGNFDILIAGFGIANREENGADWSWFLEAVVEGVPHITSVSKLVVVSDREKGLMPAVAEHLPRAYHSYCSVHIKRNVQSQFHINLSKEIHALAKTTISDDVTESLALIHELHEDVPDYLIDTDLTKWVTARFPVPRYGVVTSNAAESMNNWIEQERSMAHFAVFVHVTRRTMERMNKLRERFKNIGSKMVPWVETDLKKITTLARSRLVVPGNETLYEVQRKNGTFRVVDIDAQTCSCKVWEENQYPCVHAAAVLQTKRLQMVDYVSPYYTTDQVRLALAPCIRPVDVSECLSDLATQPPVAYRSAGRPRAVRLRVRGEVSAEDSPIVCSKCGKRGHNVRTCDRRRALREARERAMAAAQAAADAQAAAEAQGQASESLVTSQLVELQDDARRATSAYHDEAPFGTMWSLERIFDTDPIM